MQIWRVNDIFYFLLCVNLYKYYISDKSYLITNNNYNIIIGCKHDIRFSLAFLINIKCLEIKYYLFWIIFFFDDLVLLKCQKGKKHNTFCHFIFKKKYITKLQSLSAVLDKYFCSISYFFQNVMGKILFHRGFFNMSI